MGIYKMKISQLPLCSTLDNLYTIGYATVDGKNESVKVSLAYLKVSADKVNAAEAAAIAANSAAQEANAKAQLAGEKAGEANAAAINANDKVQTAQSVIDRMEELADSIVAEVKLTPQKMVLDYPRVINMRNTEPLKINYTLFPEYTGRNVLFLGDNNAVSVMPDGGLIVNKPGISRIFVIPTENTSIYKTIEIKVVELALRKVSANSLRFMGNGNLRLT
jgi:hypothetical protein